MLIWANGGNSGELKLTTKEELKHGHQLQFKLISVNEKIIQNVQSVLSFLFANIMAVEEGINGLRCSGFVWLLNKNASYIRFLLSKYIYFPAKYIG